jgi:tetratricopeptide (TPR) repeat protein
LVDEIEKLKAEAEGYRSKKVKHAAAEKLFEASTRLKDKGEEAEAIKLLLEAIKLYEEERTERVVEFLEKAAPVLDGLSQPKLAADIYLKAAKQHAGRTDHRGAIAIYLKAADAYKRANLFRDAAGSLREVAEEYEALSEPLLAAEHIEKEADARLQIKDVSGAAVALHDARDLYIEAGRFDESARCSKQVAELLVRAGNNREGERNYLQAADDLQRAADESTKTGDRSRATRFLLEAAAIYEKAKQPVEASKCHMRVAEEDLKSENINGASENFRKAAIERLLAGELEAARGIVDSIRNEEVRKTAYLKQSLALVEIFEKGDEERLNTALKEINDFSWVRLCLAFGKLLR